MAIFGWTVLFFVFVDELLAVAAAAVWGEHVANVFLAVGMALLTMLVWFLFASPKARFGGAVVRPVTKVLVFTLASVGLWASGHHALAVALFVFSAVINGLAQLPSVKVLMQD
ncbi:MAG: YrdB family protein [Propionibacteriales bacterium]|nr:YrdB family protein [Propionibacteriales bacterium]